MEFLKSFFPSSSSCIELKASRVLKTGIGGIINIAFQEALGIIAIATRTGLHLLTNDVMLELAVMDLNNDTKMVFIHSKLWVWSGNVFIWDVKSLTKVEISLTELTTLDKVGNFVIVGTNAGHVYVYNSDGKLHQTIELQQSPILDVKGGEELLFVGQESVISLWDLNTGLKVREIHTENLMSMSLSQDNRKIASFSKDFMAIYSLKESWIAKKAGLFKGDKDPKKGTEILKFRTQFKDLKQVFWIGSTFIAIEADKISALDPKKELASNAEIYFKVCGNASFVSKNESLQLLVSQESEIFSLTYLNYSWEKSALRIPDLGFSQTAKVSLKAFSNSNEFLMGEVKDSKTEISPLLSSNKFFSASKPKSYDFLAFYHDQVCELWDPWRKRVLERLDLSKLLGKTSIERIILNPKSLVFIGGPRVLIFKFHSSVDIEFAQRIEDDLEKAMDKLDDVVESALREADNVKKLFNGATTCESDSTVPLVAPTTQEEESYLENCPEEPALYTHGNLIVEMYNKTAKYPGWYAECSIISNEIINIVIVDIENDLIAIHSEGMVIQVGRMSNPTILASISVEGGSTVSHLSFAKLFFPYENEVSSCIICITSDGTITAIKIVVSDSTMDCLLHSVIIQKSIFESPIDVFKLDENGLLQSVNSTDHFVICVFKQSIRIFQFRQGKSHLLLKEKSIDPKNGIIIKSGVFTDHGSFLGVLYMTGYLQVFAVPELSCSLLENLVDNLSYIGDSFISSRGSVYIWRESDQLEIFALGTDTKLDQNLNYYTDHQDTNPREKLKKIMQNNNYGSSTADNSSNELHQKMNERGEALQALEVKFSDLSAGTSQFRQKIKEYNEQQAKKKWWQI